MWSYLRNQRSKQTDLVYLQFLSNYGFFSKNWCKKLSKEDHENRSILYNATELVVDWTYRKFQN